mgnify:CR=1 FL=1
MKIYIATRLENNGLASKLRTVILSLGHEISYDWINHGSIREKGSDLLTQTARHELEGVRTADLVIVLLPGGRGTHVELGAALTFRKNVLIWSSDEFFFMDNEDTCVFYWFPGVIRLTGPIEDLFYYLSIL